MLITPLGPIKLYADGEESVLPQPSSCQILHFGISLISPYARENEVQTWLAADPATLK
jgi:hypothetical protein